jgi:V8-like Glu-specific endopeptidase
LGIIGYRGPSCDRKLALQSSLWKVHSHEVDGIIIKHRFSTFEGNSGSPMLVERGGKLLAVALHKGTPNQADYNCARIITKEMLMDLMIWEKEMSSEIKFSLLGAMK